MEMHPAVLRSSGNNVAMSERVKKRGGARAIIFRKGKKMNEKISGGGGGAGAPPLNTLSKGRGELGQTFLLKKKVRKRYFWGKIGTRNVVYDERRMLRLRGGREGGEDRG